MCVIWHALIGHYQIAMETKLLTYLFIKIIKPLLLTLGALPTPRFLCFFPVFFPSFPVGWMRGEELLLYENLQYLGHWPYIVFFFFNSLQQSSKRGVLLVRILLVVNDGNLIQVNLSGKKKWEDGTFI